MLSSQNGGKKINNATFKGNQVTQLPELKIGDSSAKTKRLFPSTTKNNDRS